MESADGQVTEPKKTEDVDIESINKLLAEQMELEREPKAAEDSTDESDSTTDIQKGNDEDAASTDEEPEILKSEDIPTDDADGPSVVMKQSLFERLKTRYYRRWDNKITRFGTILLVAAILSVVLGVPAIRTAILNMVGVRTSVSVTAVDGSTFMPLKNAVLSVESLSAKTDANGRAKLYGIKLGDHTIKLHKAGFADYTKKLSLGMRTIDLGEVELKAVGAQYTFVLTDHLSGKAVKDVDVSSGEATARSDKQGRAVLTVSDITGDNLSVSIEKSGYRTEKLDIAADTDKDVPVKLVVSAKYVYMSKQNGRFDLYKVDADGSNREMLLPGTGLETDNYDLAVDPAGERVALVSTRDDKRNSEGYLLSTLTIANIATGDTVALEHAESVNLVGWQNKTLVYVQTVAGMSAANPNRQKIMSYDSEADKRYQLANANDFGNIFVKSGKVYYLINSTDPDTKGIFGRIDINGMNRKNLLEENDLWAVYRSDYSTLKIQSSNNWYQYKFGADSVSKLGAQTDYAFLNFVDSPNGASSAWVDRRNNDGLLMIYNVADGKNTNLAGQKGVLDIIGWLGNRVVAYRTSLDGMITDYALSLDGGAPVRLTQ